jgi:hypothetical protein
LPNENISRAKLDKLTKLANLTNLEDSRVGACTQPIKHRRDGAMRAPILQLEVIMVSLSRKQIVSSEQISRQPRDEKSG